MGAIKAFFGSLVGLAKRQPIMFALFVLALVVFAGSFIVSLWGKVRAALPATVAGKLPPGPGGV